MQLILYDACGKEWRFDIAPAGSEQRFHASVQDVSGAVVVQEKELYLFTDEAAALAYERARGRRDKEKRLQESISKQMENTAQREENAGAMNRMEEEPAAKAYDLPQRRWPPPACMPSAAYAHGRWTELEPALPGADDGM